jgi:acyl-coenzyme A synthetase/AMP-(fatty) acid ligase
MSEDKIFLVWNNGKNFLYYSELLLRVSSINQVPDFLKNSSIDQYFIHFCAALYYNTDITLLDSDLSENEILQLINKADINANKKVNGGKKISQELFAEKLLHSTSRITLFTSGTTGQPKKVTHHADTFISASKKSNSHEANIWAYAYNPTHMAGLQVFFQAIINFNTLVDVFKSSKDDIVKLIRQFNVTHISATPTFYRLLISDDLQLRNIKRVTIGGEKSDEILLNKLQLFFPESVITNIYASTEAGTLFYAHKDTFMIPKNIAGKIKIENEKLFIHSEWYDTGDVVEIITKNPLSFRFVSRSNEMINIGGNKVNPSEVEKELLYIDGIKNALVYAKENSVLGNMLYAEIETFFPVDVIEIRKQLEKNLQNYKVPRIIKVVEKIELTRSGKLKRT